MRISNVVEKENGIMKTYTVYLLKDNNCIRGWLAYIKPCWPDRCTVKVSIEGKNGSDAKNKAITAANKNFVGATILSINFTDKLWGASNFPELSYLKDKVL